MCRFSSYPFFTRVKLDRTKYLNVKQCGDDRFNSGDCIVAKAFGYGLSPLSLATITNSAKSIFYNMCNKGGSKMIIGFSFSGIF